MAKQILFLDRYPLKQCYDKCHHFINKQIDWYKVGRKIEQDKVTSFSVDTCMAFFPHLQLDDDYSLICYVTTEYHGIWGRVAAIPKTQLDNIVLETEKGIFGGVELKLPQVAAPPMEAIFCDGTPDGFLEALLLKQLLNAIPYVRYEKKNYNHFITSRPSEYALRWNEFVDIPDWRPRIMISDMNHVELIAFTHVTENGLGSSSGKDRIYISKYQFHRNLSMILMLESMGSKRSRMYHAHIDNRERYCAGKHCCVTDNSRILIAEEKRYTSRHI